MNIIASISLALLLALARNARYCFSVKINAHSVLVVQQL